MATEIIRTIGSGGDYTTMVSWEADFGGATSGDLVANDEQVTGKVIGSVDSIITVSGWTCDTTRFIKITSNDGEKFNPLTLAGAKLTGSANYCIITSGDAELRVEDLGLYMDGANGNFRNNSTGHITVDRCYITDTNVCGSDSNHVSKITMQNCLVVPSRVSTSTRGGSPWYITLKNVTVIHKLGFGNYNGDICAFRCANTNVVAYNENTMSSFPNFQLSASILTCAQNNNGSPSLGAGNVNGIIKADFTDYDNGDYSLSLGSELIDVATDLSADFTTDIVGTVRG